VAFVDGGTVWERMRDIRLKGFRWRSYPGEPDDPTSTKIWDYRWSVGGGLRVDTPVGPVRVDVGFPLKRARFETTIDDEVTFETESKVIYHFSLGYPF
jgi:outer membrane protein assembly factor BamA